MTYAPLVQLLFTVQFAEPLAPLNALEIASIYGSFVPDFTEFAQVDPAGPMPHRFEQLEDASQLPPVIATMPRVQITGDNGSRVILFQNDRFSFGWQRMNALGDDPSYPGYASLRDSAVEHYGKFCRALSEIGRGTPTLLASEIAYTDAFPDRDRDGTPRRLSSIFTFLRAPTERYLVRGFEYSWNEEMDRDGIVVVKAYGPVVTPNGITAAFLQATATFPTPAAGPNELKEAFDWAHVHVTTIYKRVVEAVRREDF